jgi:uncharacterized membrane protein YfcA
VAAARGCHHLRRQRPGLPLAGNAQTGSAQNCWRNPSTSKPSPRLPVFLAITAICFYIGYFGAGAGFLLITALSLFGWQDLHEINALKVSATTPANGIACILFIAGNQVVWRYCLLAMVTCAIGGYLSARMARRVPQALLRAIIVVIGLSMAAWFFWRQ